MNTILLAFAILFSNAYADDSMLANEPPQKDGATTDLCKVSPNGKVLELYCARLALRDSRGEKVVGPASALKENADPKALNLTWGKYELDHEKKAFVIREGDLKDRGLTANIVCAAVQMNRDSVRKKVPCPNSKDLLVWWENEGARDILCTANPANLSSDGSKFLQLCRNLKGPAPGTSKPPTESSK